jgi:putative transposase
MNFTEYPLGSAKGLMEFDNSGDIRKPPVCEPFKANCGRCAELTHAKWECKYHVVWIPKCWKKRLYGELRKSLGETFRDLAVQKECNVIEGHFYPIMYAC